MSQFIIYFDLIFNNSFYSLSRAGKAMINQQVKLVVISVLLITTHLHTYVLVKEDT